METTENKPECGKGPCPDLDFKDDGNRFTGWMWNDSVPLTQCYSGGEVYLSVRDDYMRSNAGIPYHFWEKYEESKLGDKYNGTSEKIDLDELADICRKIDAGIKKAKEVKNILELKDRSKSPETAPAKGLFLYRVKY